MRIGFSLAVVAVVLLTACGDGVPRVDDPNHPVDADGKPITGTEFLTKYCVGKDKNETCEKVRVANIMNSSKGKMPEGY